MLPECRFTGPHDDASYIKAQLARLPNAWRSGACVKYSSVFESDGRQAANSRLREYADKFNER